VGGGSQSTLWLEILANVLDCPVIRGDGDILLGAAMIARPQVTPPLNPEVQAIEPTRSTATLYEDRYHSWLEQNQHASI